MAASPSGLTPSRAHSPIAIDDASTPWSVASRAHGGQQDTLGVVKPLVLGGKAGVIVGLH